ncbi:MAG: hypothetical protein S4CHLAM123_08030 [Chlamydiales bacterium]|nr:hypothetical protein [Chlamydiales bacterium]
MKNYYFLFFCVYFPFVCVGELVHPHINALEEILVPKENTLTEQNLAAAVPIYAKSVHASMSKAWTIDNDNPPCELNDPCGWSYCNYTGDYIGGYTVTAVYSSRSPHPPSSEEHPGHQVVFYQGEFGHEKSESRTWRVETVESKKYIVHFHENFLVYSSGDSQFVVGD